MTAPAPAAGAGASFPLAARVFSLTGLVPLGAFLVVHLVVGARALRGMEAYEAAIDAVSRIPGLRALELGLVLAPLAVHGAVGLAMTVRRQPWGLPPVLPAAWTRATRVAGVLTLAFLVLHLPEMHVLGRGARLDGAELLTVLSADLSSTAWGVPWRGVLYLVGTGAVTLHFAVGCWTFLARTRLGAEARARRTAAWAAVVVGGAMWLLFVDVVVLHATGARLFGHAAPPPVTAVPCPAPADSVH